MIHNRRMPKTLFNCLLLLLAAIASGCKFDDGRQKLSKEDIQNAESLAFPDPELATVYGSGPGLMIWESAVHFSVFSESLEDWHRAEAVIQSIKADLPESAARNIILNPIHDFDPLNPPKGEAVIVITTSPFTEMRGRFRKLIESMSTDENHVDAYIDDAEAKHKQFSAQFAVDRTGQVFGYLGFIDGYTDAKTKSGLVFIATLYALSPSLFQIRPEMGLYEIQGDQLKLSSLSKTFISIMLQDDLMPGMSQQSFVEYLTRNASTLLQ
jgi:hypothetical protein